MSSKLGFRRRLAERQAAIDSLLCVGLDPIIEKVPAHLRPPASRSAAEAVFQWMAEIVDATAPFASMFKPQLAHWIAIPKGMEELRYLIAFIHNRHPQIPVLLDCKCGDIDRTQQQYREAFFTMLGADGINLNAYMGRDTLQSLVDTKHPERALVGLGRTSNSAAWEIQDALMANGRPLWQFMVKRLWAWSRRLGVEENAGVVMGAAHKVPDRPEEIYSLHLEQARELVGDELWFLIPGIGTQGGFVEATVQASYHGPGSIAINSSSAINFASAGADFAEASAREAERTCGLIREAVGSRITT